MSENGWPAVRVLYRNWRGEIAIRRISPAGVYYGKTEYHPVHQWLLSCFDADKKAARTYALADVLAWGDAAIDAYQKLNGGTNEDGNDANK